MLDPTRMDDVLRRGGEIAAHVEAWRSIDKRRRGLQAALDTMRQQRNAANDKMAKLDKKSAEFAAARDELQGALGVDQARRGRAGEGRGGQRAQAARAAERPARERPRRRRRGRQPGAARVGREADVRVPTAAALGDRRTARDPRLRGRRADLGRAVHRAARRCVEADARADQLHARPAHRATATPRCGRRRSSGARRCAAPGSCPKFEDDLFKLDIPVGPDHVADHDLFLSPTAEVQLTNLHGGPDPRRRASCRSG